jgi:predicted nuclease with TOPRIM domain
VPDAAAVEAARAVGYAGVGAVVLKVLEFLLKTFGVTKNLQTHEMEQTLGAAAKMREELRKDNEDLRSRMREMEERLETLEQEYHAVRELNDKLRTENDDLKAQVRLHEARERGRIRGN